MEIGVNVLGDSECPNPCWCKLYWHGWTPCFSYQVDLVWVWLIPIGQYWHWSEKYWPIRWWEIKEKRGVVSPCTYGTVNYLWVLLKPKYGFWKPAEAILPHWSTLLHNWLQGPWSRFLEEAFHITAYTLPGTNKEERNTAGLDFQCKIPQHSFISYVSCASCCHKTFGPALIAS